jgi:triacylglycerol esterase/lipase EstA (alpha/beta hydrolase family)
LGAGGLAKTRRRSTTFWTRRIALKPQNKNERVFVANVSHSLTCSAAHHSNVYADLTPNNPIIFCHGLFGFDTLTLGPSFAPLSIPHWRGISDVLAAAGADVLVTRVPATSAIPQRAAVLREKIAETYPGRSVHLIGHSMGGLDCRYLAHQLMLEANGEVEPEDNQESVDESPGTSVQRGGEYRREGGPEGAASDASRKKEAAERKRRKLPPFKVLSVTTVATPHRGSAFADYFLSTLGRRSSPFVLFEMVLILMDCRTAFTRVCLIDGQAADWRGRRQGV